MGGEREQERELGSLSRRDPAQRGEAAPARPPGAPVVVLFALDTASGAATVTVAAANRVALGFLGCDHGALADRRLDELFPPAAALELLAHVQRAVEADEPCRVDLDLSLPGGRLEGPATFTPLVDGPAGRVQVAMVASASDAVAGGGRRGSAPVGLFRFEAGLGNVFADERLAEILGVDHEQALGHGWIDVVDPDDRARVEAAFRAAQERGDPLDLRYRFRRPDGEDRWGRMRAVPLIGDAGTAPGFLGTLEDVTEHEAVHRLARRYATTFELTSDIVTFHDRLGRIVHMNPAAREFFTDAAGAAEAPLEMGAFIGTELDHEEIMASLARDGRWCGEVELTGVGGRQMLASVVLVEHRDTDGNLDCYATIGRDITEQRNAEQSLEARDAWFTTLFRHAPDLVAVHAADGSVRYVSPSVERILGYSPEEYGRIQVIDHVHPDDRRMFLEATSALLRDPRSVVRYEGRVRHRDGTTRVLESTMTNLLDDPDISGVVVNSRDVTDRHQAEKARRRTEATLRAIVQHSPLAIFVLDEHGQVQMWNRACEHLFGWVSAEVVSRPLPFLREADELGEVVAGVVAGSRVDALEVRRPCRDGREVDLNLSLSPLRDPSGRVIAVVGVAADVSARRAAEDALRGSEERFRLLVQHSSDLTVVLDRNFDVAYASPSVAELFETSPEEMVGHHLPEAANPAERARVGDRLRQLMQEPGAVCRFDFLQPRIDGEPRYLEVVATNLVDEPNVGGIVLNCRDVTERVLAEQQLRERELLMRFLVESASDIITIVEADGSIRYASPVAERLFGYQPDPGPGTNVFDLVHPDDAAEALRHWEEGRDRPGIYPPVEVRLRRGDGTYFHAEVIGNNLLDDPAVRGSVMTIRDISERRAAEDALRRSDERFRALIQNLNEAIIVVGPDRRILYQSPAADRMFGFSEADESPPDADLYEARIHPDDRERVLRELAATWHHRGTFGPVEYRFRRSDGRWIRVETTAQNLLDDRAVGGVVMTFRDVTARRDAEEALRESETRYRAIVEDQTEFIARFRRDGTVTFVNDAVSRFAGAPVDRIVGNDFFAFSPLDGRDDIRRNLESLTPEHPVATVEYRIDFPNGRAHWAQWTTRAIFGGRGELVEYQAVGRDITDRRRAEQLTERQAEILELIARGVPLEDTLASIVQTVEEHSPALRAVVVLYDSESGTMRVAAAPNVPLQYVEEMDGTVVGPRSGTCAAAILRRDQVVTPDIASDPCWADHRDDALRVGLRACWATPLTSSPDGDVLGALGIYAAEPSMPSPEQRQIAGICTHLASIAIERKRFEDRLSHQSLHDPLTGLPNRSLFLDRLGHALERSRRTGTEVAVLFLDLDRFKLVNDSLGHDAGDELLVTTARRLAAAVRPGDTVARFGGDEFTVLCEDLPPDTAQERAAEIAERLFGAITAPFLLGDSETFLTASIGIAMASDTDTRPEDLLRDADAAMYHAKESGKGRWELFDDAMRDRVLARHAIENALHRAIDRGELRMFLQPMISLDDGRCMGAEALVRWQHPERGLVMPGDFIPLAEETGLIVDLGYWIFEEAARQAARWQVERGEPLVVSVNLSARQLALPELPTRLADIIERTGVQADRLCLEITESVLMDDAESTIAAIERVRELGVRLSIDDFGTGYSSLGYLKRFPVDAIKIDRSFVSGVATDAGDAAIVSAVVGLAHALGLEVVAEGVETTEQLGELIRLGCDQAQGYLFAPPQPVDDVRRLLGRRHGWRTSANAVAEARRQALPRR